MYMRINAISMGRYRYSPLTSASDSIRLLRLLPSELDEADVRAELLEYNLHNSQRSRHSYEALSYVWGGLDTTRSIFIGDEELEVTPNLHAALLRLRDSTFPRILWIDAVCINQSDEAEKESQIQFMAKIYGYANRTVVWLGNEADSSDMALEAILAAGVKPKDRPKGRRHEDETEDEGEDEDESCVDQAVTSLLQREWFQRIWVLQEVAAARHVVVACGPTEIDGYAFCLGLEQIRSIGQHRDRYAQIRPVLNLIRGAIFRSRFTLNNIGRTALNICSLGELMSMYHNLNATHRHDKIFALLGMASDDVSEAGLLPDYSVPWDQLFRRLIHFLLGETIHIKTYVDKERAEISGPGCVIGSVSEVTRDMDGSQKVQVKFNETLDQYENYQKTCKEWALEATVNDVCSGDIIYLLKEASRPMIVRQNGRLFDVVVIVATPPDWISNTNFPRNLPLVWDWLKLTDPSEKRLSDDLVAEAKISWTAALILKDSAEDERALDMIADLIEAKSEPAEEDMDIFSTKSGRSFPSGARDITEAELIEVVQRFGKLIVIELLNRNHHRLKFTETVLISTIRYQDDEVVAYMLSFKPAEIKITSAVVEAAAGKLTRTGQTVLSILLAGTNDRSLLTTETFEMAVENTKRGSPRMLGILLDCAKSNLEDLITESVLIAATRNSSFHTEILELLLSHEGIAAKVTDEVIIAVLSNKYCSGPTIELLLDCILDKGGISDSITMAAFRSSLRNEGILQRFLDARTQDLETDEALWVATVENTVQAMSLIGLLLHDHMRRRTCIYITETVLAAAAANRTLGSAIMTALFGKHFITDFERSKIYFPQDVAAPKILIAAARNEVAGLDIIRIILDKGKQGKIEVTEEMIEAVTSFGVEHFDQRACDLLLLFRKWGTEACQGRVYEALRAAAVATYSTMHH